MHRREPAISTTGPARTGSARMSPARRVPLATTMTLAPRTTLATVMGSARVRRGQAAEMRAPLRTPDPKSRIRQALARATRPWTPGALRAGWTRGRTRPTLQPRHRAAQAAADAAVAHPAAPPVRRAAAPGGSRSEHGFCCVGVAAASVSWVPSPDRPRFARPHCVRLGESPTEPIVHSTALALQRAASLAPIQPTECSTPVPACGFDAARACESSFSSSCFSAAS